MALESLKNLEEIDNEVRTKIMKTHARAFNGIDNALDWMLGAWMHFQRNKPRTNDELEALRLLLIKRSFDSLYIARQTLENGYYQQAAALIRMAMEDQLTADYAKDHPETIGALLRKESRVDKFAGMATGISDDYKPVWDGLYGQLSAFAAHPRHESLNDLLSVSQDGARGVIPGSHYKEDLLNFVLYHFFRELSEVMTTAAHVLGDEWDFAGNTAFIEVNWLLKKYFGEVFGQPEYTENNSQ